MWFLLSSAFATPPQDTVFPAPGAGVPFEARIDVSRSDVTTVGTHLTARSPHLRAGASFEASNRITGSAYAQRIIDVGPVTVAPWIGVET